MVKKKKTNDNNVHAVNAYTDTEFLGTQVKRHTSSSPLVGMCVCVCVAGVYMLGVGLWGGVWVCVGMCVWVWVSV